MCAPDECLRFLAFNTLFELYGDTLLSISSNNGTDIVGNGLKWNHAIRNQYTANDESKFRGCNFITAPNQLVQIGVTRAAA